MNGIRKRKGTCLAVCIGSGLLTGCASQSAEVVTIERTPYEKAAYQTVEVQKGDKVQKGDLLVSFQSDSIERAIADYENQIEQKELLMEHYTNYMQIDGSLDYSTDITMLKEDITVAELYIEEAEDKLAGYQIVAESPGTITAIDEYLQNGYYKPGTDLITEI